MISANKEVRHVLGWLMNQISKVFLTLQINFLLMLSLKAQCQVKYEKNGKNKFIHLSHDTAYIKLVNKNRDWKS